MTLYEVLGVDILATPKEIHKAYRRRARNLHPDMNAQASPADRAAAERMMAELNAAWDVLSDPVKKQKYDNESGVRDILDHIEKWEEPPLPSGFDYWPRRGLFGPRMGGMHFARIGDAMWRALSIAPVGGDLSSLRPLWPGGVWMLSARGRPVTDDQLAHISGMFSLRRLDLSDTQVGDEGMQHLIGLDRLNDLRLSGTGITDRGLETIGRLDSLEYLELNRTGITDAGLEHLADLVILDYLDLRSTQIQGPGLAFLRRLEDLDSMYLPRGVDRKYKRALKEAIPHLEFR